MFQMIDESKPSPEDRKLLWVKIGLGIVAMAFLVGLGYFFAYHH